MKTKSEVFPLGRHSEMRQKHTLGLPDKMMMSQYCFIQRYTLNICSVHCIATKRKHETVQKEKWVPKENASSEQAEKEMTRGWVSYGYC